MATNNFDNDFSAIGNANIYESKFEGEFFSFPQIVTAIEISEIFDLYYHEKPRDSLLCPLTRSQVMLQNLKLLKCFCGLCTAERATGNLKQIEKKIGSFLKLRNNNVVSICGYELQQFKTICSQSSQLFISPEDMMENFAFLFATIVIRLKKDPFLNINFEIENSQCYYLKSQTFVKWMKECCRKLQPFCYQYYVQKQARNKALFGETRNTKERLVGIEENPGPFFLLFVYFILNINLFETLLCTIYLTKLHKNFFVYLAVAWLNIFLIVLSGIYSFVPASLLVGVEPNPGPNTIVQYLKNMEKLEECASTRKRSTSIAKALLSVQKQQEKKRTLKLNEARKNKIVAQGLFEGFMKMDRDTKSFIESICDRFLEKATDVRVVHTIDFGLKEKLLATLELCSNSGSVVKAYVISFAKVVLSIINPALVYLLDILEKEEFHDAPEILTPQMDLPFTALLMSIYVKHLASFIFEGDWKTFSNRIMQAKNEHGKTKTTLDILKDVLSEIADFIFETSGIKMPFIFKEDSLLQELQAEAKVLWAQYSSGNIDDYAFAERVSIFINEIENLLYERRKTVTTQQKEKLQYLLKKFAPVMQYCARYVNPNNGPRIEPLAILIGGPTGVGKSTFTVPFLLALMSRILPQDKKQQFMDNHNDFLFFRANENEFWDGYKMRNVAIVYDDFGQMKDSVGAPSADAFEIIRLKNTAPYHLHFAAIEDKQRNYAVPKLIFATTNLSKLFFEGITCSEAVSRRFDLAYIQVPKVQYCKTRSCELWERRLDIEKLRQEFPEDLDDPSTFVALEVAEFIPWDFSTGKQREGDALNFWQLLDKCQNKFTEVTSKGDRMLQFHRFLKENPHPTAQMDFNFSTVLERMKGALKSISEGKVAFDSKVQFSDQAKNTMLMIGAAAAATLAVSHFFYGNSQENNLQAGYEKAEVKKSKNNKPQKTRGRNVSRVNRAVTNTRSGITVQSGDSRISPYLKLLKRNMYKIADMEGEKDYGWATFLFDRVFLIPRHFLLVLDTYASNCDENQTVPICFKNPFTGIKNIVIDWKRDVELYDYSDGETDYVFMQITEKKCRLHSDITEMFVDETKLRTGDKFKSFLVVQRDKNVLFFSPDVRISLDDKYEYDSGVLDVDNNVILVSSKGLIYSAPTELGDCGSLLLSFDTRFSRPTILGMHTAAFSKGGKTSTAIGNMLMHTHLMKLTEQLGVKLRKEEIEVDDSTLEGFNALSKVQQPRVPSVTKIEPSLFQDELWETTTKPAHLRSFVDPQGQRIDPAKKARLGYVHDEVLIESEVLEFASHLVCNEILKKNTSAPWEPRVFSFEEAVKGVDGVDFVDAVNRSTSPGFPYVLDNRSKGKTKWLGSEGDIDFNTSEIMELKNKIMYIVEQATLGVRMPHCYVDYLKDERRPVEKVDIGKTRQFMACGMDYLIAVKMFFGDFIRHVCQNRITNGIAVGMNPYEEWDLLVDHLTSGIQKNVTAGDYAKYDARIPVAVGYEVLEIVESFYYNSTKEDRQIRELLFLEIVNSMHIAEGTVYEFVGGNPSGQPFTSVFNSVANLIMISYLGCVNHLENGSELSEYAEVFSRTRFQVFGDDNVIAFLPKDLKVFGQQAMESNAMRVLGMEYTNESKDDVKHEFRNISQVSFLKRGFRKDHGKWQCPLDISVLRETLQWNRKGATESEIKLRIEAVCAEFARHGKTEFEKHIPLIVKASVKHFEYVPKNSNYHAAMASDVSLAF